MTNFRFRLGMAFLFVGCGNEDRFEPDRNEIVDEELNTNNDCPAGQECGGSSGTCGNGSCDAAETAATCPTDCEPTETLWCGDGTCSSGESGTSCAVDCVVSSCGDGLCAAGESAASCEDDCGPTPICGNALCEDDELDTCPVDCGSTCCDVGDSCGWACDGFCNCSGNMGWDTCDCGSGSANDCGDGSCSTAETPVSCPIDCRDAADTGACGNAVCDEWFEFIACPADCGCGDGVCAVTEFFLCEADCAGISADCSSDTVIAASGGTVTNTTSGTGTQAGSCGNSAAAPEKVYSWVPFTSGTATITIDPAIGFDAVLYVRSGSCTIETETACIDSSITGFDETVTLTVTSGTTYRIFVDGYEGDSGSYTLTVTAPATGGGSGGGGGGGGGITPSACSSSTSISATGGTVSATTSGTGTLAGSCGSSASAPEKAYSWTPTSSGAATITVDPWAGFDAVLYVRSGSCSSGTEATCVDNATSSLWNETATLTVAAWTTYYIIVDGYNGDSGSFTLTVTAPTGGSGGGGGGGGGGGTGSSGCSSPTSLPAAGGTMSSTTSGTGSEAGSCGDSGSAPEKVYSWTPTTSGTTTITVDPSFGFDAVLYVRSDGCAFGSEVSCTDDSAPSFDETVTLTVAAWTTYYVFVDGYDGDSGSYTLTVTAPTSGSGSGGSGGGGGSAASGCSSPISMPASGGTMSGTTSGSGVEAGSCGDSGSAPERVYEWTPTTSGVATITVDPGTGFDAVVYVRSDWCESGAELACADDNGLSLWDETVTVSVDAWTTYYIFVDGYDGDSGPYSLTIDAPVYL